MPLDITYQPVNVLIDHHDSEGKLISADAQLTAVIVRLDGQAHDPKHKGRWHLEARFGQCHVSDAPLFATPEEADAWMKHRPAADDTPPLEGAAWNAFRR
ncbi:hypothetical protein [Microvirga pakistanensis]|uniref:hypothetical protein n=1 Tax=Microvirga pakistanensis TaxID=1682650 RepID=UPI00106B56CB|nr:hypothetical protein [Microvirga pakistanensis]